MSLHKDDWMQDLQQDARNVQEVVKRIEELSLRALHDNMRGRNVVGILNDIIAGAQLLKKLMGVK